ncbi:MAG TPA: dUTP diphosphatase [Candidatus Krumholzibacterium sp.]|nr:dUTP diphosphatase [Candidatus Krumholzibacterium sp.]
MEVSVMYLPHHEGLPGLERMTPGSSGFDIPAACDGDMVIGPGRTALVPAGFKLAIPAGFEGQVRPRSGLALKESIGVLNSPGTIDADFRGEVCVILHNFSDRPFTVRRGDRIAQIVFCSLPSVDMVTSPTLDGTDRGAGGFGHTGRE